MTDSNITPVQPGEFNEAPYRLASIRFDCLVKMFDYAQRETQGSFMSAPKPLPPQWFKSEMRFTLEFIDDADPYAIGMAIKEAYFKLKQHIEQYERSHVH